ncbi:hypothetical protein BJX62DRAFT_220912 [Aspergillus germanicus]
MSPTNLVNFQYRPSDAEKEGSLVVKFDRLLYTSKSSTSLIINFATGSSYRSI